jgi:hypothetical protein
MRVCLTWLSPVVLGLGAVSAWGQESTTVQLPTFSSFSTNATVSAPDRGSAYLGGVKRAASGRNEFGTPLLPFGNRSFGTERSVSGARVSVFIHDFEAMDRYLLNRPTPSRGLRVPLAGPLAAYPKASPPAREIRQRRPDAATGSARLAGMSVAELRAERLREQRNRHEEALQWIERGRGAEAAGKANVARVYYQMAARGATGELQLQVAARLKALDGSPAAAKLAQSRP